MAPKRSEAEVAGMGIRRDYFHLFPKLPVELQLLIWDFWRASRWPAIRHCLMYTQHGLYYAAYDVQRSEYVTVSTTISLKSFIKGDPTYPMVSKVQLGEDRLVKSLDDPTDLRRSRGGKLPIFLKTPTPVSCAYVDFEKDVFFIESIGSYPAQLPFLYSGIDPRPNTLNQGYDPKWHKHIQQLAIRVPRTDMWSDEDNIALLECSALRTLLIVSDIPIPWRILDGGNNIIDNEDPLALKGYILLDRVTSFLRGICWDLNWFVTGGLFTQQESAEVFAEQMRKTLGRTSLNVDIKIVEDLHDGVYW
ncbi:hypothetical protein F4677DRAFT_450534 [Hypoxylon crocopeplum]|nr:hypothetical protein F4677DRAFT_450534 [Hypoxylon crocopeplum]